MCSCWQDLKTVSVVSDDLDIQKSIPATVSRPAAGSPHGCQLP